MDWDWSRLLNSNPVSPILDIEVDTGFPRAGLRAHVHAHNTSPKAKSPHPHADP